MQSKTENWMKHKITINRWGKNCAASKVITSTREGIIAMQAKTWRARLSHFYVAVAFLMGLIWAGGARGQAPIAPWLATPAPVSCTPYSIPNGAIATLPSPATTGATYKIVLRTVPVNFPQYYFEPIATGVRINSRSGESGNFGVECYVLDVPFVAPASSSLRVELFGYNRDGSGNPTPIAFDLPLQSEAVTIPTFVPYAIFFLAFLVVVVGRRYLQMRGSYKCEGQVLYKCEGQVLQYCIFRTVA